MNYRVMISCGEMEALNEDDGWENRSGGKGWMVSSYEWFGNAKNFFETQSYFHRWLELNFTCVGSAIFTDCILVDSFSVYHLRRVMLFPKELARSYVTMAGVQVVLRKRERDSFT